MRAAFICLTLLLCAITARSAHAHESRPLYVEINEVAKNSYRLQWRVPPSVPLSNLPSISLPEGCKSLTRPAGTADPVGMIGSAFYRCDKTLAGGRIGIAYPVFNPSVSTMMKFNTASGERHVALLGPEAKSWRVPEAETAQGVARDYTFLGVRHIWAGVDHLLFLVCLLWIAGTPRRILVTVTGFTLAHSATLALAALEIVRLPTAPVEAAIALSIVFLATEIFRGRRETLTWRYPIAVSSSFGLLHGLGFAAVLTEIGLPQTELVTGLLFFNVGVEVGQLMFVAATLGGAVLVQRAGSALPQNVLPIYRLRLASSGLVGIVAAWWLIERTVAFGA